MSRSRERRRRGGSRSRRTPKVSSGGRGGPSIPTIPIVIGVAVIAVAGLIGLLIWQSGKDASPGNEDAVTHERNPAPDKAGEYVNLPEVYQNERGLASYIGGNVPNTAPHVNEDVDYSDQGLPPAGGPHWSGACGEDPEDAPRFCGPAPLGIYRAPWSASTLIHNMEHGGTVIWYNTTDQAVIDDLEDFANSNRDKNLVLAPYPEMAEEQVAITVWSRRGLIPASEYTRDFIDEFMDDWYCAFDPEGFC